MSGKVRYNELTEREKKKFLGEFYSMVASLEDREEVKNFFKDLLTMSETVMISRRIQVAMMLLDDCAYEEIRKKLKVGYTTISQVEKWVHNGFGGYQKAIEKYKKNRKDFEEFDPESMSPFSPAWVRKKYPLYHLLTNMTKAKRNTSSKQKK